MRRLPLFCIGIHLFTACGDDGMVEGGASTEAGTDGGDASSDTTGAGGLLEVYDLEGDALFPEGIAFDPVGQAFFVGSLEDGSIHRISAEGTQGLFSAGLAGNWSTAGLAVDADARRLWACSSEVDQRTAAIWVFNLATGDLEEIFELTDHAEGAGCNDVALDASGVAFVSDPPLGSIHRIEAGGAAEVWATDETFAPEVGPLGLNGLAVTPDGSHLIVAKFLPARLFRISLADPSNFVQVELSGDPFVGGAPTAGADGIAFNGDALWVTFADDVKRVDFDATWASGTVTAFPVPGAGNGLSTAAEANGVIYVVKSEVTAWVLGREPDLPFQIIRVPGS